MVLSYDQICHFEEEGYVIVDNALTNTDLDPVIGGIEAFIDEKASALYKEGLISELYTKEPFTQRLALITQENTSIYDNIDIMYMRSKSIFHFLGNQQLLDLVEPLVGPEITCSPIQHLRAKLPTNLVASGTVEGTSLTTRIEENVAPWHQDAQVHHEEADPVYILTVWLPLCDTDEENGCLEIMPRVHHSKTVYWGIDGDHFPEGNIQALPMKKNDVLLMHKLIPHRSTPNCSDKIRWSVDLRYQQTGLPTGRSFYPNFITRSRRHPEFVLTDYETWSRGWKEALKITPQRPPRKNRPTQPTPIQIYKQR
tara:strand:- start:132 stop:1064 length:933 start_codon:yes stop_codon:yes gene_type:complete